MTMDTEDINNFDLPEGYIYATQKRDVGGVYLMVFDINGFVAGSKEIEYAHDLPAVLLELKSRAETHAYKVETTNVLEHEIRELAKELGVDL